MTDQQFAAILLHLKILIVLLLAPLVMRCPAKL